VTPDDLRKLADEIAPVLTVPADIKCALRWAADELERKDRDAGDALAALEADE